MTPLPLAYIATEIAAKTPKVPHKDIDYDKLIPVVLVIVVMLLVTIHVCTSQSRAKKALKDISSRLGLGYETPPLGDIWPFTKIKMSPRLNGIIAGRQVVIRHVPKGKKTFTNIDVAVSQRGAMELRIAKKTVLNSIISLKLKKFTTGDRFADDALMMHSDQPDIASVVLGAQSIASQLSAFVRKHKLPGILTLNKGLLRYEERGMVAPGEKADRIEALIPICLSLAEGVELAGEIAQRK